MKKFALPFGLGFYTGVSFAMAFWAWAFGSSFDRVVWMFYLWPIEIIELIYELS